MPLLYRPAYVLCNTPKLQYECTAGVKEISSFLQHNPATLSHYSIKERINHQVKHHAWYAVMYLIRIIQEN